jgi:FkbM family methyltransferase
MALRQIAIGTLEAEHRLNFALVHSRRVPGFARRFYGVARARVALGLYGSRLCPVPTSPNRVLATVLQPGDTFLDIGAADGEMVNLGGIAVGREGLVYAFEPRASAVAHLNQLVASYGLNHATIIRSLVGETTGSATLYASSGAGASSSISAAWADSGVTEQSPITRLDDWAASVQLRRLDLLKIDVEGAELLVLRGAPETLRQHHPVIVLEIRDREVRRKEFGYDVDDLLVFLRSTGYDAFFVLRPAGFEPIRDLAEIGEGDHDMIALSLGVPRHRALAARAPFRP